MYDIFVYIKLLLSFVNLLSLQEQSTYLKHNMAILAGVYYEKITSTNYNNTINLS